MSTANVMRNQFSTCPMWLPCIMHSRKIAERILPRWITLMFSYDQPHAADGTSSTSTPLLRSTSVLATVAPPDRTGFMLGLRTF